MKKEKQILVDAHVQILLDKVVRHSYGNQEGIRGKKRSRDPTHFCSVSVAITNKFETSSHRGPTGPLLVGCVTSF